MYSMFEYPHNVRDDDNALYSLKPRDQIKYFYCHVGFYKKPKSRGNKEIPLTINNYITVCCLLKSRCLFCVAFSFLV